MLNNSTGKADILLLLEGTYPFITGGVSNWLHQLLTNLSQYHFAIIFLGGQKKDYKQFRYMIPNNVIHLEMHFLFDQQYEEEKIKKSSKKDAFLHLSTMHEKWRNCPQENYFEVIDDLQKNLFSPHSININDFLHHPSSWNYLSQTYLSRCPEISFLDYFWMMRNLHMPIWYLVEIAKTAPHARILHSPSTGYAGFLAAMIHSNRKYPLILTEHGIYVKERKIELLNQWIGTNNLLDIRSAETRQYLTKVWIDFFEVLAKICYTAADPIISLFDAYRLQQIKLGAPAEKTIIVPNGISISEHPASSILHDPPTIALIGRVVPIKDVKTFIRALVIVLEQIPQVKALIIGALDEDKKYADECKELANVLNLNHCITFTGVKKVDELLPDIDLLVLTSISEGLPLVILEAFAAGIAVVATDTGACRELLYGGHEEDKALGESGIIVEIANTTATAAAIIDLLTHPQKWQHMSKVGRERVQKFYSEQQLLQRYTEIYDKALAWQE